MFFAIAGACRREPAGGADAIRCRTSNTHGRAAQRDTRDRTGGGATTVQAKRVDECAISPRSAWMPKLQRGFSRKKPRGR